MSAVDGKESYCHHVFGFRRQNHRVVQLGLRTGTGQARCYWWMPTCRPKVGHPDWPGQRCARSLASGIPALPHQRMHHGHKVCRFSHPTTGFCAANPRNDFLSQVRDTLDVKLKETFDIVLIDSPPLQLVCRMLSSLSQVANTVLYVKVKADSTPYPMAQLHQTPLHGQRAFAFGVVLNQRPRTCGKILRRYSGYGAMANTKATPTAAAGREKSGVVVPFVVPRRGGSRVSQRHCRAGQTASGNLLGRDL